MTLSSLRILAAGGALALAAWAAAPAAQAQALHPLPPDFLATLKDIDSSSDEMAASVTAIKNADLTYALFSRRRVGEAIARMEQQLPVMKAQTADLRREESLRLLLSTRTAFSEAQRNIGSISDILHGVTVRTPVEAAQLDKLLARLDGAAAHLDAALKQFDSGAMRLAARASPAAARAAASATAAQAPAPSTPGRAPASTAPASAAPGSPAIAPAQASASSTAVPAPGSPAAAQAAASGTGAQAAASGTGAQAAASPTAAQAQGLPPLPPDFLATLDAIDASADEMAISVTAIKKADLTFSLFSQRRVADVLARMERQLPMLKSQTANLRRDGSLGVLLSTRTTFSGVQRDVGAVSDILHGATVRSQAQADALDRLLAQLDGGAARLNAALKQFDSGALAMIELLDKPRP